VRREWLLAAALLIPISLGVGCKKKTTPPVNTGPETTHPLGDLAPAETTPSDLTTSGSDVQPLPPGGSSMPPAGGRVYVVQKGDTLMQIARNFYNGDASQWRKIAAANNLQNPNQIKVGQRLTIP